MGALDDVAAVPYGPVPATTRKGLALVDQVMMRAAADGLSSRQLAALVDVSPGSLSAWRNHETWPSAYLLGRVGQQVGYVLAWHSDDASLLELGEHEWRQPPLPGLEIEVGDGGYRPWFPGGRPPREPCAAALMRLGAEIAWRRVHRAQRLLGAMAAEAEVDRKTWHAVEMGVANHDGKRPSAAGIDKFIRAAAYVALVTDPNAPPDPWPIVWRSIDAGLPDPPWTDPAKDNLDEAHLTPRKRRRGYRRRGG